MLPSPIYVRAGVERIPQHGQDARVREPLPVDLGRPILVGVTRWELQVVLREISNDPIRCSFDPEALEQQSNRSLDLLVGIEHERAVIEDVSGWRREHELPL